MRRNEGCLWRYSRRARSHTGWKHGAVKEQGVPRSSRVNWDRWRRERTFKRARARRLVGVVPRHLCNDGFAHAHVCLRVETIHRLA